MENNTTYSQPDLKIGYAEAKNDVADVKMFASILSQLKMLTEQVYDLTACVEGLGGEVDYLVCREKGLVEWIKDNLSEIDLQTLSFEEITEKYELDTTDVLDDDGDYPSVYLKKRQK